MSKQFETINPHVHQHLSGARWTWLDAIQLAVGVMLIMSAAVVYSMLPQPTLLIPAIMGGGLLFHGVRPFLTRRQRRSTDEHQEPTGHLLS